MSGGEAETEGSWAEDAQNHNNRHRRSLSTLIYSQTSLFLTNRIIREQKPRETTRRWTHQYSAVCVEVWVEGVLVTRNGTEPPSLSLLLSLPPSLLVSGSLHLEQNMEKQRCKAFPKQWFYLKSWADQLVGSLVTPEDFCYTLYPRHLKPKAPFLHCLAIILKLGWMLLRVP